MDFVNLYLVPGVLLGAIYALGAVGITLVFAILRFAHLAHGDLITVGAFLVFGLSAAGLTPWAALPVAMVITAALAVGIDWMFYEFLRTRPKIVTVISSLGIALMLRSAVQVAWGIDPQSYTHGITRPLNLEGFLIKARELETVAAVIGIVLALQLFLTYTRWGKAMRAMSDSPGLAQLCGVDLRLVTWLTWIIAGALCAASGFFLGLNTELHSMMGWNMLLPMFAAAILGGVGRLEGAVLGGLVVGVAEELSVLVIPSEYKAATAFVILIAILLVRPTGLLYGKTL